jgi:ABC-type nitrate/sulfonate/bicarbonate transport system ATPase subunit
MLLMDEPFSALDALTRGTLQDEVLRICGETRQTVFMITHDIDEAIMLSDKILLHDERPECAAGRDRHQYAAALADPPRRASPASLLRSTQSPARFPRRSVA